MIRIKYDIKQTLEVMRSIPTLYKVTICVPDCMDFIDGIPYGVPHGDSRNDIIKAFRKAYSTFVMFSPDFVYVGSDDNENYHLDDGEITSVFESTKAMTVKELYDAINADDNSDDFMSFDDESSNGIIYIDLREV